MPGDLLPSLVPCLTLPECAAVARTSRESRHALHHVQDLDARGVQDPERLAAHLEQHGEVIESLNLSQCSWVDDTWGPLIQGLKNLQALDLSSCSITDTFLAHLPPDLEHLDLTDCTRITDAGIVRLKRLKLETLGLYARNILDLGFKELAAQHLAGLNLTRLQLHDCPQVSGAGLPRLQVTTRLTGFSRGEPAR
jgi:hypothetical protein